MKTITILIGVTITIMSLVTSLLAQDQAGVRFTQIPAPNSPLISFRIILRAGSINDPKGKDGLNSLTADIIVNGGTKEFTYSQVVDKLYPWAASIDVQTD
jgi:zinc protease